MKLIALDDEPYVLEDLESVLRETAADCELTCFREPDKALLYVRNHPTDVAFLDIEMGSVNGITIARQLKAIQPDIHIIFVTSHDKYAVEAFSIHATGYLMKPVVPDDIRRELTFLYGERAARSRVQIQTFGGFRVYVDGKLLEFKRSKAKELLAYLVDRRGVGITTREACTILWEEELYDTARKNYFQMILSSLRSELKNAGAAELLIRKWNSLSIDTALVECDYYRFIEGDAQAINCYRHDYMPGYSWGENTMGTLEEQFKTEKCSR